MKKNNSCICRLCGKKAPYVFNSKILGKYRVSYYKCEKCGLLQTEKPFWLKEAYTSAIIEADTGLLSRNVILSKIASSVIYFLFDKNRKHLDYAGGYGVLTRLMRDSGFDYYWTDPMAENLFAKGFEARLKDKYQVITAFEFLEHLEKPLDELKKIADIYKPEAFLFSTRLYTEPINKKWWYFVFHSGQHIAFYNMNSLEYIAKKLNMRLYSNGINVHLLTGKKVSMLKCFVINALWPLLHIWILFKMKSKTFEDFSEIPTVRNKPFK